MGGAAGGFCWWGQRGAVGTRSAGLVCGLRASLAARSRLGRAAGRAEYEEGGRTATATHRYRWDTPPVSAHWVSVGSGETRRLKPEAQLPARSATGQSLRRRWAAIR